MSGAVLLDVNVLVAIAWPNHVHHAMARDWFIGRQPAEWATCPMTESGFVRVSSNPKAIPAAVSPVEAIELLTQLREQPGHTFWPDSISIAVSKHLPRTRLISHSQVTDAYLLAMARERAGAVATFDRGMPALAQPDEARDVLLLQPMPDQRRRK